MNIVLRLLLLLSFLFIKVGFSQENDNPPQWEIVGDQTFPEIDQRWSRANGICGIGQVKTIYVDPDNNNHLIIGTFGGGVWETNNALSFDNDGVIWKSLSNNIPIHTVNRILVQDDYLYASSSSRTLIKYASSKFKKYGMGVVKKKKNSNEWIVSDFTFDCRYFDLIKTDGETIIYAISKTKAYKSFDNGKTWDELTSLNKIVKDESVRFHRIIIKPDNPNTVFIFSNNSKEILYKTTDGGKTWQDKTSIFKNLVAFDFKKNKSTTMPYYDKIEKKLYIALHKKNDVFIVSSDDWEKFDIVNKSTKKGLPVSSMKNSSFIKVDENDFLFGATHLHHIKIGNFSKTVSTNKIHDDIRDLKLVENKEFNEQIIFIGHDGGISYTKDLGKTYINISGNLNLFQCYNMAYNHHNNHRIITIGVQDGSWYRLDRDGSNKWDAIEICCEGAVYTQPDNPNVIYFINNGKLVRYDDGLDYPLRNRKNIARLEDVDAPIAIHPNNPNILLYAKFEWPNSKLKISYNKGDDSKSINIIGNGKMRGRPSSMAFDKNKPNVFYMSSIYYKPHTNPDWIIENHLYKSENMTAKPESIKFSDIIDNLRAIDSNVLDKSVITDIEAYDNKLWICFGNLSNGKKVYFSEDAGDTWKNISFDLPNTPANRLKYNITTNMLFLGTDEGVFSLSKTSWRKYGTGLPKAIVTGLEIDNKSEELIASTYGRSVWVVPLLEQKKIRTCDDIYITKDTVWTTDHTFCGNLIIEKRVKLTIKNANISAKNIVLNKKAVLNWNKGLLSHFGTEKNTTEDRVNMILNKKAKVSLNKVTIENYDIQVTRKASLTKKNSTTKNSSINILKRRRY